MESSSNKTPAIRVSKINKCFKIPHVPYRTLKQRVLHPTMRTIYEEHQALQNISVTIERGEFFGIVGRNGSGKSTLLKIIAGIYRVDDGEVDVNGSLSPFIELGVGFNPELSGRENLFLNGTLLGMTRKELDDRYDEIVKFAELDGFMDVKLRNFSSGMVVRLAFSIAIQANADIMLIDEVLAVGDVRFQRKCFDVFKEHRRSGRTVVFVSHDMDAVQRFCDRALLLEQGRPIMLDHPRAVAHAYNQLNAGLPGAAEGDSSAQEDDGSQLLKSAQAWVESAGSRTTEVMQGSDASIVIDMEFARDVVEPAAEITITGKQGQTVFCTSTEWHGGERIGERAAGQKARLTVEVPSMILADGHYWISVSVEDGERGPHEMRDVSNFVVNADHSSGGIVDLPHTLDVDTRPVRVVEAGTA